MLWKVKGALALGLMRVVLPACEANNEPTAMTPESEVVETDTVEPDVTEPGVAEAGTEVEEVAKEPTELLGETVTVSGEVEEVFGPNTFKIQGDDSIGGDEVLVIATESGLSLAPENQVQVTGEVRKLVFAELEREYNLTWDADIRKQIEAEYTDKPVIVGQVVETTEVE